SIPPGERVSWRALNRNTEDSYTPSPLVEYLPARPERSAAESKGPCRKSSVCFDFALTATLSMSGSGRQCANVICFDLVAIRGTTHRGRDETVVKSTTRKESDHMDEKISTTSATVLANVGDVLPDLEAVYKDLHAHPELSMQENRTAGIGAER